MRKIFTFIAVLFAACMMAAVNISGTVDASTLPDDAEVVLTGNTNLYMDVNKTIKSIQADYPLIVNGESILTVQNQDGNAIHAVGDIDISGETINVFATESPVYSQNGNITLKGNITISSTGINQILVYAPMGFITTNGVITLSKGRIGINASRGVNIEGGSVNIYDVNNRAIIAPNGTITITGDIIAQSKDNALECYGDLTINNATISITLPIRSNPIALYSHEGNIITHDANITIKGGRMGINASNKNVNIEGGSVSISDVLSRAIIAPYGTITMSGDIEVRSSDYHAIESLGDIVINHVSVSATGGGTEGKAIYSKSGTITLNDVSLISPIGGEISGGEVLDEEGHSAKRVFISNSPTSGAVALSTLPIPGNELGFTLSGEIADAETENTWQISDDDVNWQDIVDSPADAPAHDGVHQQRRAVTTLTYTPKESEMGKYLRVKVAAAGHTGYIYSPSRQIAKKICTDVPVVPTLTIINDKVYLSNAKTTQEYIIFNYSKEASSLTASDWNNAVTPESEVGFFELGGSSNANNTVFTRVKETPSTLVGEQIAEARIYIGTSVYMTDVELSVSKTVGYFQNFNNELNCKVGDVIRCDASPVPSNATNWYGVSGSNWTVDFHNTGSQYGTFYEDAECTRPISSSSNYSTVYLKTLQEKNYLDVRILVYNSAIGYKTRYVQFNVTPDGYFPLLDYIDGCSRTIAAGEKITGIEVSRRPFSGSVYGLTTEVSGEGTAPIVSFSLYETMTINAINATPGVYVYTPLQNGHPLNNNTTFTITVTDGKYAVDSLILRENAITADPNEELELVAQLMPSNSEAAITWTSSNPSVATVTNGIVTIAANAPIGAKATIIATANGKSDECQITVSGEEYDLYVASTRVTSRNRDDILGDGKFAFDGMNTLEIKGNYNISNSANLVCNTGIDGLYIDIAQACTISQGSESYSTLFDLRKNTTIRGEQMTVNGNGVAFGTQGGMTLTLDSANLIVNAIMPFKGSGIADDSMNIINSRVEVNASGSAAIFSFTGGISLTDCYIQTPAGGEVVNGAIEDGKGSQVRNLLIVPNPEKVDPALAFASSEATATINETFVAPVLNNPNGLAVSYYSEDPMVAIVNEETGEVTPVSAGTTTITAYTNGDLFHEAGEASYLLTVLKGTVSLAFSAPTASVKVDATEFVLPTLSNPQDVEVTYSSSDPSVATVDAFTGDVTLVAAGTTTITATFAGDEKYLPSEASYVLTVEPSGDPTAIEDVRFESDKAEKVLIDGILYIALPDGKIFDAHGLQVK